MCNKTVGKLASSVAYGLVLLSCAPVDRDVPFEHPPESTYVVGTVEVRHDGAMLEVESAAVTEEFFERIARSPWLGRTFIAEDFGTPAEPAVVLSHGLWKDLLDERPEIVGKTLLLNDREHTVLGVMPPAFEWPPGVQLWMPR